MTKMRLGEVTLLSRDLEASVEAWAKASGLDAQVAGGQATMSAGDVLLRVLSPQAGAGAAELVAERGDGMYGITIEVDDLVEMMAHLRSRAVLVSGVSEGVDGRREVTIDPRSTFGVPIRLVEKEK